MRKSSTFWTSLWIFILVSSVWAEQPSGPERKESVLVSVSGTVEIAPAGKDNWTAAKANQKLQSGVRLRTGKKSRAAIKLPNNNVLKISEGTTYSIP